MALYQKITITDAGAELISGIILNGGNPLTFEAVAVGSGELAEGATPAKFSGLIQEAKRLPIETVTNNGGMITVTARLATDTITADLYHREIGVYANGILLAYGNTGDKYDYIPAAGNNAAVQKIIRVPLAIGTMQTTFAEMDSTDLVTHAALEARVAKVVEPIVREKVTVEMVEDTVREAVDEVTGDIIDKHIDKALFEAGEYRTTNGTQDYTARCFEITNPASGRIDKIAIPCRSATNAFDRMYKGTPVYLSVFEKNEIGEWEHIGMSTNANYQTAGATATWNFDNLKLSGRPIRFIVVTAKANTQFDTSLYMGARVTTSTAGAAYEESSLATAQNYLIDGTFSGAYLKEKYTRETEETAATGWAWIYDHPGAGGDYLMTIGGINIYVPDSSSLATDAEVKAQYIETINAAQPYVTATTQDTPAEVGEGGYYFILTATEKGLTGNVTLSGNPAAVKFSGNTLTGGKDNGAEHIADASCHVSAYERKKWNGINAYRLFAGQPITEMPSSVDLSQTLLANQMCWYCKHLTSIAGLDMRCAINTVGAFEHCERLATISGAQFFNAQNASYMFADCPALAVIGDASFEYTEIAVAMFLRCTSLESTGTAGFRYLTNASYMFDGCTSLYDITSMVLASISDALHMFRGCILNLASVQHIANNINTVAGGNITIGINAELEGNSELATALETIRGKGWTVTEEYNTKTA